MLELEVKKVVKKGNQVYKVIALNAESYSDLPPRFLREDEPCVFEKDGGFFFYNIFSEKMSDKIFIGEICSKTFYKEMDKSMRAAAKRLKNIQKKIKGSNRRWVGSKISYY